MNAIWAILNTPQASLGDFTERLMSSKGYQQMMTTHMQGNAL